MLVFAIVPRISSTLVGPIRRIAASSHWTTDVRHLFFSIALMMSTVAFSQRDVLEMDYSNADSTALNYPEGRYDNAEELALQLTEFAESDAEKFRILFRWVANNIEYRYGRSGTDPDEVLRKGRAVCEGYSALLQAMCDAAGIPCKTITGHAKSYAGDDIPKDMRESDHAWNAVKLGGRWHLVDVTWAAGDVDPRRRKFTKRFDETYFLANPCFFMLNHYPDDPQWNLCDTIYNKGKFKRSAVYSGAFDDLGMSVEGYVKGRVGSRLRLSFTTEEKVDWVAIRFEREKESRSVLVIDRGGRMEIDYQFEKEDRGVFYLFVNGFGVMSFIKK